MVVPHVQLSFTRTMLPPHVHLRSSVVWPLGPIQLPEWVLRRALVELLQQLSQLVLRRGFFKGLCKCYRHSSCYWLGRWINGMLWYATRCIRVLFGRCTSSDQSKPILCKMLLLKKRSRTRGA